MPVQLYNYSSFDCLPHIHLLLNISLSQSLTLIGRREGTGSDSCSHPCGLISHISPGPDKDLMVNRGDVTSCLSVWNLGWSSGCLKADVWRQTPLWGSGSVDGYRAPVARSIRYWTALSAYVSAHTHTHTHTLNHTLGLLKEQLTIKLKPVTIYSPSCCSKPVWLSFFCETQKETF